MVDVRAEADRLIALHAPLAHRLTSERTAYQSQLIPVTPYILVACVEAFGRYPEMIRTIEAAMPPEEIGRRSRHPGTQVNTVYLWSIANFFLIGRKVLTGFDPSLDDPAATHTVLDFWERVSLGLRGDGTRTAEEGGHAIRVYEPELVELITAAARPVDDDQRALLKRCNATLINYLFLLYFDTRVGSGDTGPYDLGDGRTLILRDYYRMAESDFWWSDAAAGVPYRHLVAGLVLRDVSVQISDFGTSRTDPEDYLDRLVEFSLFTTDDCAPGELRPVPLEDLEPLMVAVRAAQSTHYRRIAAMSRDEMIACGAYVYFSFLRPFAETAGVIDQLDWTVPRDLTPETYDLLVQLGSDLGATQPPEEAPDTYYLPTHRPADLPTPTDLSSEPPTEPPTPGD